MNISINAWRSRTVFIVAVVAAVLLLGGLVGWILLDRDTGSDMQQTGSPSSGSLTFAAAGDFGASDTTRKVLRTIAQQDADFAIALGDFSYGDTATEEEWCDFVKEELGQNFPFQLVAGNHDLSQAEGHIDEFANCLPSRMTNLEGVYGRDYFFDRDNLARFIMISPDLNINGTTKTYAEGTEEYKWLSDSIDKARDLGIKWVVVSMHKNCISIGRHSCAIGADLMTLLAQKRVDLILQGHEHAYLRSKMLTTGPECPRINRGGHSPACVVELQNSESYPKGAGSILAINGAGGRELRGVNEEGRDRAFFADWHATGSDPAHGPLVVSLTQEKLEARFVSIDGEIKDSFVIE